MAGVDVSTRECAGQAAVALRGKFDIAATECGDVSQRMAVPVLYLRLSRVRWLPAPLRG
jgi:hypothetical protein